MILKEKFYAGVIGQPVAHSLSPQIFEFLAASLKESIDYRRIEISPRDLKSSIQTFKSLRLFGGWNVTFPHKESIIPFVDSFSKEARELKAVNVVKVSPEGLLTGHNTDIFGVLRTIQEQDLKIQGKSAVIFGAGGAAIAAAYALGLLRAAQVAIVNRTLSRAQKQASRLRTLFPKTEFLASRALSATSDLIPLIYINATPLGMKGYSQKSLLPKKVNSNALAFDLIYGPKETPFLKTAQQAGLSTVGGLDMLVWQALATWEIWFKQIPDQDSVSLKFALKAHLKKIQQRNGR